MTFNNISNEKKLEMLDLATSYNHCLLFRKLIQLNFDPNDFNLNNFNLNDFLLLHPSKSDMLIELNKIITNLETIEEQRNMI